ncbi:hypothetical protein F4818DRAFT_425456 [Hypoxylon cercidicola]|nr:hypothetical protein F4818DRAFT_425456 [Hypoxylon cercidicola]
MVSNLPHALSEEYIHSHNILTAPSESQECCHAVVYGLAPNSTVPSEQAIHGQYAIDLEAKNSLNRVDTKPCSHINGTFNALCRVRKAQPSLHNSLRSIYVGEDSTAYRWVRDSEITFRINHESFPNPEDAVHAANNFKTAVGKWNSGNIGVSFREALDDEPAVFQLAYSRGGRRNSRVAESFFPNDVNDVLNGRQPKIVVFPLGLKKKKKYYYKLDNIFCHELGHVLGLRHEFAQEHKVELQRSCVKVGKANSSSVMNYHFDNLDKWCIQDSDYISTRAFYDLDCKEQYCGFDIKDVVPIYFRPDGTIADMPRMSDLCLAEGKDVEKTNTHV